MYLEADTSDIEITLSFTRGFQAFVAALILGLSDSIKSNVLKTYVTIWLRLACVKSTKTLSNRMAMSLLGFDLDIGELRLSHVNKTNKAI